MYYIYKHHTLFSIKININMEHQDWKQVILNKNATPVNKSHVLDRSTQEYSNAKKMDDETENVKHTQVGSSIGKRIQNARLACGFTSQKALAQAINVKPDVIMSYESGKAIPNNMIMQKLRRVLKTKL